MRTLFYDAIIALVVSACAFAQTGSIRGHVLASNDESVSGIVAVTAPEYATDPAWWDHKIASTDIGEDGSYEIRDLPPGKYAVRPSAVGWLPKCGFITICADSERVANFELAESYLDMIECYVGSDRTAVRGKVVDRYQYPVAGAHVCVNAQAYTDRDGGYGIGGLSPGEWTVYVDSPFHRPVVKMIHLKPGETRTEKIQLRELVLEQLTPDEYRRYLHPYKAERAESSVNHDSDVKKQEAR